MTITESLENHGIKVMNHAENDYIWRVEYNGKEFVIKECDGRVDYTKRYSLYDLTEQKQICTRAIYRTILKMIKKGE